MSSPGQFRRLERPFFASGIYPDGTAFVETVWLTQTEIHKKFQNRKANREPYATSEEAAEAIRQGTLGIARASKENPHE